MATQLNNAILLMNDVQFAYTADSLTIVEGLGESSSRNAVVGGGETLQIFSEDLGSRVGQANFTMPSISDNSKLARAWKLNKNNNVLEVIVPGPEGFSKIFTQAIVTNDIETSLATDGNITIEIRSNPAQ